MNKSELTAAAAQAAGIQKKDAERLLNAAIDIIAQKLAQGETVQDQALEFIQEAGIMADSVNRVGDEIIVTLPSGGSATLYSPGDFDKYDLSWRFSNAADEEVAAYLEHALTLLSALEKRIPADTSNLSASETMRARNYVAMVDKGLLALESVGRQGLDVLLVQMESQPESELNGLRIRLVEQLTAASKVAIGETE